MTSATYRRLGRSKSHASHWRHMRPISKRAAHKQARKAMKQELNR